MGSYKQYLAGNIALSLEFFASWQFYQSHAELDLQ
jgi:hypothetical protein